MLWFYFSSQQDIKALIDLDSLIVIDDYYDYSQNCYSFFGEKGVVGGPKLELLMKILENRRKELKWNNPFVLTYKNFNKKENVQDGHWTFSIELKEKSLRLFNHQSGAEINFIGRGY